MLWIVLQWVYWIGFVLLMLIHMFMGSFSTMANLSYKGRVVARFPGFFGALIMCVLWPIILPFQLTHKRDRHGEET